MVGERARRVGVVERVRLAGVEAGKDGAAAAAKAAVAGARRKGRVVWVDSDRRRPRMLNVVDIVTEWDRGGPRRCVQ